MNLVSEIARLRASDVLCHLSILRTSYVRSIDTSMLTTAELDELLSRALYHGSYVPLYVRTLLQPSLLGSA